MPIIYEEGELANIPSKQEPTKNRISHRILPSTRTVGKYKKTKVPPNTSSHEEHNSCVHCTHNQRYEKVKKTTDGNQKKNGGEFQ